MSGSKAKGGGRIAACYRSVTHNWYCLSRGSYKVGDGSLHRELGPNLQSPSPDTPTRLGPKLNSRPVANYRRQIT
jgi:hypothetical protein